MKLILKHTRSREERSTAPRANRHQQSEAAKVEQELNNDVFFCYIDSEDSKLLIQGIWFFRRCWYNFQGIICGSTLLYYDIPAVDIQRI